MRTAKTSRRRTTDLEVDMVEYPDDSRPVGRGRMPLLNDPDW